MSDETPRVDCHECRDLSFARNLIAQMKEGYGRHNSNRAFRDAPRRAYVDRSGSNDETAFRFIWAGSPANEYLPEPFVAHLREAPGPRVIGRIANHAIRERWQDCEVGDAVPDVAMLAAYGPVPGFVGILHLRNPVVAPFYTPGDEAVADVPCEDFTFERVAVHMRPTHRGIGPANLVTEHFWKRLS